jgi:hypothetical protein
MLLRPHYHHRSYLVDIKKHTSALEQSDSKIKRIKKRIKKQRDKKKNPTLPRF